MPFNKETKTKEDCLIFAIVYFMLRYSFSVFFFIIILTLGLIFPTDHIKNDNKLKS